MILNKEIKIKIKYIIVGLIAILISLGIAVNEIKSNTNSLVEQTKLEKIKSDSLSNQLTENKDVIDSIVTTFGLKEKQLINEKDSLHIAIDIVNNSKVQIKHLKRTVTKYDNVGNVTEIEKTDSGEKTEEKTETFKKEYTDTKNKLTQIEKEKDSVIIKLYKTLESKDSLTTLVSKMKTDSIHSKFSSLIKNQIIIGNNLKTTTTFDITNETYLEYNRNLTKTIFTKFGINHNTYEGQMNSFGNINNYKAFIGAGYKFNL